MTNIDAKLAKAALPPRTDLSDKRSFGQLLCICSSRSMPGAAVIACRAAYRSGVGLVRLISAENACAAACGATPECVLSPVPCVPEGFISADACLDLLSDGGLSHYSAVLFGCGVGVSREGRRILSFLLKNCSAPLITDADGLNILSAHPDLLRGDHENVILTPHARELERLLSGFGLGSPRELADKYRVTLVCKGPGTHIFSGSEEYVLNAPDSALSKGGSGDLLAGIISSLAAQGASPLDAAVCGVFLHSRAGALARESLTAYSTLPSDVIETLPDAFSALTAL